MVQVVRCGLRSGTRGPAFARGCCIKSRLRFAVWVAPLVHDARPERLQKGMCVFCERPSSHALGPERLRWRRCVFCDRPPSHALGPQRPSLSLVRCPPRLRAGDKPTPVSRFGFTSSNAMFGFAFSANVRFCNTCRTQKRQRSTVSPLSERSERWGAATKRSEERGAEQREVGRPQNTHALSKSQTTNAKNEAWICPPPEA